MWIPQEYFYDTSETFGLKARLDLCAALRAHNPELERDGALYGVICVLDENLAALPSTAFPMDQPCCQLLRQVFEEHFGKETVYGWARLGRTLVFALRREGLCVSSDEEDFFDEVIHSATGLFFAMEDCLGESVSLSVGPTFNRFQDCEQVACEALTAADFLRFVDMPTSVVTPEYCANVKQLLEKRYPDYRIPNYERPLISAIFNGNFSQAERIADDLLTAHLLDPLCIFPSLRSTMVSTMRLCQSMVVFEPRSLADAQPQIPRLQEEMSLCPSSAAMRELIHRYFALLEEWARQNREIEVRNQRIGKILRYIYDNVSNPLLGAPMVCDQFDMSTTYFSRVFKEDMGVNFSVFLQTLRITQAKALLLETDLPLNTIAQKVGYISSQNLLRLFKRYEGMSPSSYRLAAGNNRSEGLPEE